MKRIRDYAQVKGVKEVDLKVVQEALALMNIDQYGLDQMDRKLLKIIIDNFSGGPVGLNTLAATLQEEAGTIEEIFEPYLMQLGLLNRTSKGRIATVKTYKYLGLDIPKDNKLF